MWNRHFKMNLDAVLYSTRYVPLESAQSFILKILPQMGWGKSEGDDVILDVGCGPGGTTRHLILSLFSSSSKIFAVDSIPDMIALARKHNSCSQIEYRVANIEDWSVLERWKNQITKVVSILCFHWLKDQQKAFRNVYHLLRKEGEAAFFFALRSTFHASVLDMQNSSRWSHLFNGVENYVPESQFKGYADSYYKKMLEEMGFEVLYCQSVEKIDVFSSEKEYREFFCSICVLRKYVPTEQLEEFENDFIEAMLQKNGRDTNGNPTLKAIFMEIVGRKKD
ncbi:unnamed protein product [Larinioides sclopetarius]|uniref:Methyltransferase type 11 domain-containing protein n=1 Tax=Larinioides sclopetarius TaxID=280406 RepID=A0AAV2BAT1_9ARAC